MFDLLSENVMTSRDKNSVKNAVKPVAGLWSKVPGSVKGGAVGGKKKGPKGYAKGGKVRGAGIARKGVRPCKMR